MYVQIYPIERPHRWPRKEAFGISAVAQIKGIIGLVQVGLRKSLMLGTKMSSVVARHGHCGGGEGTMQT